MNLSREQFAEHWKTLPESQETHAIDAAWRRYKHVHDPAYVTELERDDPTFDDFHSHFQDFLSHSSVRQHFKLSAFLRLSANRLPWTPTDASVQPGQMVSTFAAGRVWRSRNLDLWLRAQFALWFKIGINGRVFNSTGHSNTFRSESAGQLYVANQFPGQFGEPFGGRPVGQLSAYKKADGEFGIWVVIWRDGVDVQKILDDYQSSAASVKLPFVKQELERMRKDRERTVPKDWSYLWFIGPSHIYSLQTHDSEPCMHCKPHQNVGILQKNFVPPIPFKVGIRVSWDWLVTSLPSRLREDLTISHDYLSIAFEFENHRDLTYTWSWELPKDFGFWCPLPTWADREYHIVLRSGTDELGQWIGEQRDLYADYLNYVEEGKRETASMPVQIVRAWFIAGNRWQRFEGEMSVKRLHITRDDFVINILEQT